jgi:aminopeptidase N
VTLLSDSFALAQAGQVSMASYFDLLRAIGGVQDAGRGALFALAATHLRFLDAALAGTPAQARVRTACRALFEPELVRLTWTPRPRDEQETLALRGELIEELAHCDHAPSIAHARAIFDSDAAGRAPLPPSIRGAVIKAVGMHADRARFERLLAQLQGATSEEDRWLYASALAAGRDAVRARRLMAAALAGIVPPNIASQIPGMVGQDSPFGAQAYRFTVSNFARLLTLAGFAGKAWLLPDAAWQFNDEQLAQQLAADQQRVLGEVGAAPAARGVARIELLAAVKRREGAVLEKQLAGWKP